MGTGESDSDRDGGDAGGERERERARAERRRALREAIEQSEADRPADAGRIDPDEGDPSEHDTIDVE